MSNKASPALETVVNQVIEQVGPHLVIAAPLGIGKPNPLINAFYRRALNDPQLQLDLFTALSLAVPAAGKGLRGRFARPFLKRHFGAKYPQLEYIQAQRQNRLPENIRVTEFYLQPGAMLGKAQAQRHYISSNYTHVARDMEQRGVNVICQMVARRETSSGTRYSLSCNPDVTLDLVDRLEQRGSDCHIIAMVNQELPYMTGDAEVDADFFDHIIDEPEHYFAPYAIPRAQVSHADYAIGLHASTLIHDGGTLQIGIGSLGDALCHALIMRDRDAPRYHSLIAALEYQHDQHLIRDWGGLEPFSRGLYAASEMFLDGLLHLYDADILRRRVYDDEALQTLLNRALISEQPSPDCLKALHQQGIISNPLQASDVEWLRHWGFLNHDVALNNSELHASDGRRRSLDLDDPSSDWQGFLGQQLRHGRVLHAAFFLGSRWFYQRLHELPPDQRDLFAMCRVSRINQLYQGETLDRLQRLEARFLNTCMKMTLLGAAVSDGLSDGQMVSGVGGQYNFVAMAHALERGRSILMLRSTRSGKKGVESNLVWEYPHATIPRHLRDLVITEYGVADLRGRTDEEVIQALITISDARFQESLRASACAAGKLSPDWRPPAWCRDNTPQRLSERLGRYQHDLPPWPFGSDFSTVEERLVPALQQLASAGRNPLRWWQLWRAGGIAARNAEAMAEEGRWAERLALQKDWRDRLLKRLIRGAIYLSDNSQSSAMS
ncbi:MAG: hypothetical protein Tsb002_31400 [Wenzhouxiangellaceae bacterium]